MGDFLLFRLYGPLASWGTIAVGQERPSDAYPSRSALLGLLAAAMGVRRTEEAMHEQMAAAYGFAVRVDAPGSLLRDYHTAQVPPEQRGVVHRTRRDELCASSLNTILSSREYRCDAVYTVALWLRTGAPFTLDELADGLRKPKFTLYLGRKSCPLALPVQAHTVTAADLKTAFAQARFADEKDLPTTSDGQVWIYWDTEDTAVAGDLAPMQTVTRHDRPLNRQRWQFGPRREHQTRLPRTDAEES